MARVSTNEFIDRLLALTLGKEPVDQPDVAQFGGTVPVARHDHAHRFGMTDATLQDRVGTHARKEAEADLRKAELCIAFGQNHR